MKGFFTSLPAIGSRGVLLLLLLLPLFGWGQTTVFNENFGTPTATTTIANYVIGTAPATFSTKPLSYTYGAGGAATPGDIRISSSSTGYAGASGNGNAFLTSTSGEYGFAISGIDASAFTSLQLTFGYRKESATALASFMVEYSTGGAYTALTVTGYPAANAATGWFLLSSTLPPAAQVSGVSLRFRKTGTLSVRIDDIILSGATTASTITTGTVSPVPVCATTASDVTIDYTTANSPTGTFSMQLSDASGSFAAATALTTVSSTATSITATIPAGTTSGAGYKVRVITTGGTATTGSPSAAFTIVSSPTVTIAPTATQSYVAGASGSLLTATEIFSTGTTRAWQVAPTATGTFANISPAQTGLTYTPTFASAGTYFVRVLSTFAGCGAIPSNVVEIDVTAPPANTVSTPTFTTTPVCATAAAPLNVTFTASGPYDPANTFTVQLSDAAGSFASPVTIGSITNNLTTAQTVAATIPAGTPSGTGYKIQVVASNPAVTSLGTSASLTIVSNPTVSIAPAAPQTIPRSTNGTALTVTETPSTGVSRVWQSATVSGGPYATIAGQTGASYTPNFATAGVYYVVATSTFAACSAVSSNEVVVTVNNPVPTITSVNPSSGIQNTAVPSLQITGTNFINGQTTVTFDGASYTPTSITATVITLNIPASAVATTGSKAIVVTNPGPGGGSATSAYVVNPPPCVSSSFDGTPFPPTGWASIGVSQTTTTNSGANAVLFNGASQSITTPAAAYPTSTSFYLGRTSTTARSILVKVAIDGQNGTFVTVATFTVPADISSAYTQKTVSLAAYSSEPQVWVRFERSGEATTAQTLLDDVAVFCGPAPAPGTISVSTNGPLAVGTTAQTTPSTPPVTYTVGGTGLGTSALRVQAPAGFQVSTDAAFTGITTDANFLSLMPSSGTVATTTIYVRLSGFGTVGPQSGNVVNSSGTSPAQNVAVTGTLNIAPREINIKQGATSIASNGTFAFPDTRLGVRNTQTFTIENLGGQSLSLGAFTITAGTDFTVVGVLPTTVPAFGSVTFSVRFEPSALGAQAGTLSIVNNDSDENPYLLNFTGNGLASTFVTWTGAASDGSFFSAANWSTGAVPGSTDDVLLDHSTVTGSYVVSLSPGTSAVSSVILQSLTVNPGGSSQPAIELVVPASNTLSTALTITAATNQPSLSVYDQGIVTNSSGAASASGIVITGSVANAYLYNGGTYRHVTVRSAAAVTDNLSGVGGTENGTFLFDAPAAGTTNFFTFQGLTFGNLSFGPANTDGYGASGATSPAVINGNLTTAAGTSFSPSTSTITLKGNLVNNGNFKFTGTTLVLGGLALQTISGTALGLTTSASTLGASSTLQINNPAGVALATPVRVNGTLELINGIVASDAVNLLTLAANATVASDGSSFVNGPVGRVTGTSAATVVFPIGSGTTYRPLVLAIAAQPAGATYIGSVTEQNSRGRGIDNTNGGSLTRVSAHRFYGIAESGTSNFQGGTITLPFSTGDGVTDLNTLRIARSANAGTPYADVDPTGTPTTSGTPASGTIAAATTALGDFALATTSSDLITNPLPVELITFTAQRQNTGVALKWTTASEKNSAYFDVQRSLTGSEFVTVSRVAAQGSSSHLATYLIVDGKAPARQLYYRLRQVDTDGKVAFSPVVNVAGSKGELTLYPNPAHGSLSVLADAGPYRVLNMLGQVLLQGSTEAGAVDVARLAPGIYQFELQTSAGRVVRKFVKE